MGGVPLRSRRRIKGSNLVACFTVKFGRLAAHRFGQIAHHIDPNNSHVMLRHFVEQHCCCLKAVGIAAISDGFDQSRLAGVVERIDVELCHVETYSAVLDLTQ